jgi:DNA polymerase
MDQGIARDIMAQALVKVEQEGMRPVIHVHDEIVAERGTLEKLLEIMSEVPSWAAGLPLMAEGYEGPVWTKETKGCREATYMYGRPLCAKSS